jgi:hypothetical protein
MVMSSTKKLACEMYCMISHLCREEQREVISSLVGIIQLGDNVENSEQQETQEQNTQEQVVQKKRGRPKKSVDIEPAKVEEEVVVEEKAEEKTHDEVISDLIDASKEEQAVVEKNETSVVVTEIRTETEPVKETTKVENNHIIPFDKDNIEHKKMLVGYMKTKGYSFTDDSGKALGKRVAEMIHGDDVSLLTELVDNALETIKTESDDVLF